MALTDVEIVAAFDAETGTVLAALATTAQKLKWFNEGTNRFAVLCTRWKPKESDITWALADRSKALPSDFIEVDKLVTATGYVPQAWRVWGRNLVLDDPDGATQAGGARVYYWAEWPLLTSAPTTTSGLTYNEDYIILAFALYRFYKLLSSNRSYYKRYSTLVGQNAVSLGDLQSQADRWYQDFLDGRDEAQRQPPAYSYEG